VYKKVLKYYKATKALSINPSHGICGIAALLGHPNVFDLFTRRGYYQNYVTGIGFLQGPFHASLDGTNFRIKFIKREIVELEKLLSEGYTDV